MNLKRNDTFSNLCHNLKARLKSEWTSGVELTYIKRDGEGAREVSAEDLGRLLCSSYNRHFNRFSCCRASLLTMVIHPLLVGIFVPVANGVAQGSEIISYARQPGKPLRLIGGCVAIIALVVKQLITIPLALIAFYLSALIVWPVYLMANIGKPTAGMEPADGVEPADGM